MVWTALKGKASRRFLVWASFFSHHPEDRWWARRRWGGGERFSGPQMALSGGSYQGLIFL